jgi:hypothetical protein
VRSEDIRNATGTSAQSAVPEESEHACTVTDEHSMRPSMVDKCGILVCAD